MIRFVEQRDNKYRVRFVNLGDWEDDGDINISEEGRMSMEEEMGES